MIELPPKFKQALGNGVRTSLYPLVRIYKGARIDDPLENATEVINLSCKETNIGGSAYKPLLLNTPSIKSSADIVNNKYTISSVSLSISNAPFQGKIFSDDIQSLLNAVCQVYYCANGIDSIEDCLLVYTGTIRRFSQSAETIKLELEDLTQQMLSTKIPASTVPDEEFYKEDDIGKPYPMVYGFVDKSPVIPRSLGQDSIGELKEELTKFHIDKRGKEIEGLWEYPNSEDYGNPFLTSSHPLIVNGHIKEVGTLSAYEDGFIPIPQNLDYKEPWSYYVDGITDPYNEDYNKITFSANKIYDFEQTNGVDSSASITVDANALINEENIDGTFTIGLPTRIYRPIDKVECFTFCDDEQDEDLDAINRIYGFTNFVTTSVGVWKPWEFSDNVTGRVGYEMNWSEGDQTWWEPTTCNENINGGDTSSIDENWKYAEWLNSRGLFPADRLQNGTTADGMYLCCRNPDGARNDGNKSGMAAIKLILKDNVGSLPCSAKVVYDAAYHSFANMSFSGNQKLCYPASFWTGENIPEFNGMVAIDATDLLVWKDLGLLDWSRGNAFPYVPDGKQTWDVLDDFADDQSSTEESIIRKNAFGEALTFNNTTSFDNIKFGIEQFPTRGQEPGNDKGYVAVQLFNVYLLQDAIVDQPLDKKFFADVKGRAYKSGGYEGVINTIVNTRTYGDNPDFVLGRMYLDGECNLSVGDSFKIENSIEYYNGIWEVDEIVPDPNDNPFGDLKVVFKIREISYIDGEWTDFDPGEDTILAYGGNWYATNPGYNVICSAQNILKDILEDELNYKPNNVQLIDEIDSWQHSFTLNEQKEAKEVFEGLFESSLIIPSFNAAGQFTFISLHQVLDDISHTTIDNEHILKYSFSLTKLDDVKNQVNVKYKKNYGSGEFDEETGYGVIDGETPANDLGDTYDEATRIIYDDETKYYNIDYYGLTSEEAKLEVETDYIRDDLTARKLQKRLLMWYANQHLITKIDLPASYMNLETGDYIKFSELMGGKKAFGYDYTITDFKNGQVVYPVFFITKISKSLDKVSIEAVQVHRGEYGEDELDYQFGDPNDNPNYGDDTIVEEEPEEEYTEDPYLNVTWLYGNNNLNSNPQAIIDTNIEGEFEYEVFITYNDEEIIDENEEVLIPLIDNGLYDASNYIDISVNYNTNNQGNSQGGNITLSTSYLIPEEHNGIVGILRIFYEGTEYNVALSFSQNYIYVPPPVLGDINSDGIIDILDVVPLILAIQGGSQSQSEFLEQHPQADVNQDEILSILDIIQLINIIQEQ